MEILSSSVPHNIYVIVRDSPDNIKFNDDDLIFSKFYLDKYFLQFRKHKTTDDIIKLFLPQMISPSQVQFLTPPEKSGKTKLYFCLIQNSMEKQFVFDKLIMDFTILQTYKIRAFIAEKAYSVSFESEDDLIRVAAFIPMIDFTENGRKSYFLVGSSWFDLPIVRFSNLSEQLTKEEFLSYVQSRSIYVQYQKTKVTDGVKITSNVITINTEEAKKLITDFNFSSFYNMTVYVNWFVDPDTLCKLEKYRIKVTLTDEDQCQSERQFCELMEQYGSIFKASYSPEDKTGIVIFRNYEDAFKVGFEYDIEFLYARGMLYNFPYGTTDTMIKDVYFKSISTGIQSVVCHNLSYQDDNQKLPYFLVTCNSILAFEQTSEFVENNEFYFGNIRMQPFLIQIERSLNVTKQKYERIKKDFINTFTLLVQQLPENVTANQLLDLYSKYGTITFFKMDKKQFDELTAMISFKSYEEMEIALNETNDSHFLSSKLQVSTYEKQQQKNEMKSQRKICKKKLHNQTDSNSDNELAMLYFGNDQNDLNDFVPSTTFITPLSYNIDSSIRDIQSLPLNYSSSNENNCPHQNRNNRSFSLNQNSSNRNNRSFNPNRNNQYGNRNRQIGSSGQNRNGNRSDRHVRQRIQQECRIPDSFYQDDE